ncbi:MAG TPA: hypothetical protein VN708_18780 [Terriglobales bacterium]|nr:hypothetical protein [Terriglobales bacterium]
MVIATGRLKQKAYNELKEFLVIAFYLWVVFGLFLVYRSVILNEEHISYLAHGVALVNALVLGKFVLIARAFHLGDRANEAPLIYPTLLKSALFSVVLACFKIFEDAATGFYHGKSFSQSIADLGGGTWKGILTLTALLFVLLIPFFAFGELQRVLGEGKLVQLFFRRAQAVESSRSSEDRTKQQGAA